MFVCHLAHSCVSCSSLVYKHPFQKVLKTNTFTTALNSVLCSRDYAYTFGGSISKILLFVRFVLCKEENTQTQASNTVWSIIFKLGGMRQSFCFLQMICIFYTYFERELFVLFCFAESTKEVFVGVVFHRARKCVCGFLSGKQVVLYLPSGEVEEWYKCSILLKSCFVGFLISGVLIISWKSKLFSRSFADCLSSSLESYL